MLHRSLSPAASPRGGASSLLRQGLGSPDHAAADAALAATVRADAASVRAATAFLVRAARRRPLDRQVSGRSCGREPVTDTVSRLVQAEGSPRRPPADLRPRGSGQSGRFRERAPRSLSRSPVLSLRLSQSAPQADHSGWRARGSPASPRAPGAGNSPGHIPSRFVASRRRRRAASCGSGRCACRRCAGTRRRLPSCRAFGRSSRDARTRRVARRAAAAARTRRW